ncbi:unnamed protein product [Protopolystoma xenopodis]|uniref:Dynein heavy chain ATP-binding dynein motor region domain-containing protein n=1 Tax=Protopolystoma xenopodis TaxID=117903 RepID=A0A3S5CKU0_9PLAT|nr:unnamed protein product [Protopolystoma xenopodis]
MPDYMRFLEMAITYGHPVLLQNVQERLDPSLDPILNRSFIKVGGATILRIGDKEIEYNLGFRCGFQVFNFVFLSDYDC